MENMKVGNLSLKIRLIEEKKTESGINLDR